MRGKALTARHGLTSWRWFKRFGRGATVLVDDQPHRLYIRSRVERSHIEPLMTVPFIILWSVLAFRTGWGWLGVALGSLALVSYLWNWWPDVEVHLHVTDLGLETRGNFGGGYQPIRHVRWRDIVRLEYGAGSGGDDAYSPSGLWAVGNGLSTCVLPGLTEDEASTIAVTIYRRFPDVDMAEDAGYRGFFRDILFRLT